MRLVWQTEDLDFFKQFCAFLDKKEIEYTAEEKVIRDWGNEQYGVPLFYLWIHDEESVEKVREALENFQQDRDRLSQIIKENRKTVIEIAPTQSHGIKVEKVEKKGLYTRWIILLCVVVFFLEVFSSQKADMPSVVRASIVAGSPVKKQLLIDYPHAYELLDELIKLYGYQAITHQNLLPKEGQKLYEEYTKQPVWIGIYPLLVDRLEAYFQGHKSSGLLHEPVPILEKVSQYEVWRLVTPIFLHNDILHLFFNMVWLVILGPQIELRIGFLRYVFLIVLLAVFSNLAQYFMSGPNFLGFSGVISGMATFIWMRKKRAPWEGYFLTQSTFQFLICFIATLALISFIGFLLAILTTVQFSVSIANTAHIAGALLGCVLGRLQLFSWQVDRE